MLGISISLTLAISAMRHRFDQRERPYDEVFQVTQESRRMLKVESIHCWILETGGIYT